MTASQTPAEKLALLYRTLDWLSAALWATLDACIVERDKAMEEDASV